MFLGLVLLSLLTKENVYCLYLFFFCLFFNSTDSDVVGICVLTYSQHFYYHFRTGCEIAEVGIALLTECFLLVSRLALKAKSRSPQ